MFVNMAKESGVECLPSKFSRDDILIYIYVHIYIYILNTSRFDKGWLGLHCQQDLFMTTLDIVSRTCQQYSEHVDHVSHYVTTVHISELSSDCFQFGLWWSTSWSRSFSCGLLLLEELCQRQGLLRITKCALSFCLIFMPPAHLLFH